MAAGFYDSDAALAQYLLFHYGTPEQICPLLPEARGACGFPARCVTEMLPALELPQHRRALDLGCAVGRSSFELARNFGEVTGIDFSERFVAAAREMKKERAATARVPREGALEDEIRVELPRDLPVENVRFEQGDACNLRAEIGPFDFVLMANLIDRLPDPARCLAQLPDLIAPAGGLVITSPYTWMEDYTPREKWLVGPGGTLAELKKILAPAFVFRRAIDLPFLIRDHRRKYQWSVAEASVWQRK
jgi:putative 4-mercaptohistidine N1-methyltranferase